MPQQQPPSLIATVNILISVPKRYFKHAVDRNRVKRQVREAYRKNKQLVVDAVAASEWEGLSLAFIWTDNQHRTSQEVEERVCHLLTRLSERLTVNT